MIFDLIKQFQKSHIVCSCMLIQLCIIFFTELAFYYSHLELTCIWTINMKILVEKIGDSEHVTFFILLYHHLFITSLCGLMKKRMGFPSDL